MKSIGVRIASVVVGAVLFVSVLAVPVVAACNAHSKVSWIDNCWVGYGYDTAGNYVAGIQRVLYERGYFNRLDWC